jgi:hypothetical protein
MEIEITKTERQKAIIGGVQRRETLPESSLVGSTPPACSSSSSIVTPS